MPETMESARRWSGFVCPDCRFVFRVPRDHDGKGIVCPSCRRVLRIPTAGDVPPPLFVPVRRAGSGETSDEETPRRSRKKRHGRKGGDAENMEWERQSHGARRGENKQMRFMLIGGSILFGLIVIGVAASLWGGKNKLVAVAPVSTPQVAEKQAAAPVAAERSEISVITEAEPIARRFLEATRIEEILPLVRHPEVTEKRIRGFYPDGRIEALGMSKFNTGGSFAKHGAVATFSILTRDQEQRSLSFVEDATGLKVDWESWAGWSEISWDEFLSKKPQDPHVFRVLLTSVEYYNFDFKDDAKWQSYRLESPDQEHSIYGYVEKGSLVDTQIRPAGDAKAVSLMLSLKFPGKADSPNQVLIERLVAEGWVEAQEKP